MWNPAARMQVPVCDPSLPVSEKFLAARAHVLRVDFSCPDELVVQAHVGSL